MTIHKVIISVEQQAAGVARMKEGQFTAANIEQALMAASVPRHVDGRNIAYRAADRLIQKVRRQGLIVWNGNVWTMRDL